MVAPVPPDAAPTTLDGWRTRALRPSIDAALARIWAAGPDPAWISLATTAQVEAQLAWIEARPDAHLPLRGVPFAVKDNIDVAGWTTTAACPAFAYTARSTARVVERLLAAGAVLLGKTNLDQFATGLVGTRSPYGAVPNAFDPAYISGGSSAGSASVVARGLVAFALGTDTAGSGRVPAGFNNLVGMKPTPGRVSNDGVLPACRSLDCVSVFALLAGDAARILALIEHAPGEADAEARFHPAVGDGPAHFPAAPRIGCPAAPEFYGDAAYAAAFDAACARLQALGALVERIDLAPFREVARLLYEGPYVAERYTVLGALLESHPECIDPAVRTVVGSARRFSAADAFRAEYRRRELEVPTRQVWQRCDMLMVPTAPTLPTLAAVAAEPLLRNQELGYYTNFVNFLGLAAVAVPAGFTAAGLPFGVTFMAPGGSDAALLAWAAQWQASLALPLGHHLGPYPGATPTLAGPRAAPRLRLAVVGAHLAGLPLHHQLQERGAQAVRRCRTAPRYRLYALPAVPGGVAKPALARDPARGLPIEVEVYDIASTEIGAFLAQIPPPLGLGSIELDDGSWVHGFICEPWALTDAPDISVHGGWRAYLAATGNGAQGRG